MLPSGSPELMPAERLWPLSNEAIANRLFEEICEVEEALLERCLQLLDQAETIKNLTNLLRSGSSFSRTAADGPGTPC